ncbi:MAG: geranylgeranylglycerol-phosphate geranylgeranyltransferase [Flavobacteriaceae bacterium]|nr:geranylgeranylglycerol-phosphate geranylgeranyltransferase [Flavobacteriaceae bacterium]
MLHFLNLIRWKNLLIIAFAQCVFRFVFFKLDQFQSLDSFFTALTTGQFLCLMFSTLCLAIAGYIINDVFDAETDTINNPEKQIVGKHINESLATNLFIIFNILGVALGFYVSNVIGKNAYSTLFVIISALLYVYATYLKGTILIGNIVISLLVASSILIIGVFELSPLIIPENRDFMVYVFKFFLEFSLFAFLINLVREMIKDIEDIDGDHAAGLSTLPIAIGRERAGKITFFVCLLPIIACIYYVMTYLTENTVLLIYFLFLIIGPLIYVAIKILGARDKKDYRLIGNLLKIIMLLGICSVFLF